MTKILNGLTALMAVVSVDAQGAFLPVCERTEAVKRDLETQLQRKCTDLFPQDLLAVKRVAARHEKIRAFKRDDFSGLKNLEILNIRSNNYTELPEGLFEDLGNLKTLVIIGTTLRNYPDDFLEKTPLLEHLHVFDNPVRSISESVFRRLENLKFIQIIDFDRSLQEAEKERLRRVFPENGKVKLFFN